MYDVTYVRVLQLSCLEECFQIAEEKIHGNKVDLIFGVIEGVSR